MDEEKKILEKRSSFKGWKERNKERMDKKRKIIGIVIIVSVLFAIMAYPYMIKIGNKDDDNNVSISTGKNDTYSKQNDSKVGNISIKSNKTDNTYSNKGNKTNTHQNVIGKIGVPLINNGLEITVKSVNVAELRTTVWIIVRNKDDYEKPFKLGSGTFMLDNLGQQYENIRVARSAEIAQTNLSAQAMREGAVFFEPLKEGRSLKKLTLNVNNNNRFEFILDNKTGK